MSNRLVVKRLTSTGKVRAEVFARAGGRCEVCATGITDEIGHLDHFFGRAKAEETPATCWALCLKCDGDKTNNSPSAAHWIRIFVVHTAQLLSEAPIGPVFDGYLDALNRAVSKLAVQRTKQQFSKEYRP